MFGYAVSSFGEFTDTEEMAMFARLVSDPMIVMLSLPTLTIFIIAWWLWKAPASIIPPDTEFDNLKTDLLILTAIKLVGLFILLDSIPSLISYLSILGYYREIEYSMVRIFPAQQMIVAVLQLITGSVLVFKTEWVQKKLSLD